MSLTSFDFVVIGGGITGLWATLHLAERGLRVRLLEKSNGLGGATAHSGAGIRYYDPDSTISAHVERSMEICQRVMSRLPFVPCRSIYAIDKDNELYADALTRGYDVLTPKKISMAYPALTWNKSLIGIYDKRAGYMNPEEVCQMLRGICHDSGATLDYGCEAFDIDGDSVALTVHTSNGLVHTNRVILATSYWTARLLEKFGIANSFINRTVTINYLDEVGHGRLPFIVEHDTGFHMRPTLGGGLLFGVPHLDWNVCPDRLPGYTVENREAALLKLSEYVRLAPTIIPLKTVVSADSFSENPDDGFGFWGGRLHVLASGRGSSFKYAPSATLDYINKILG